MTQLQDLLTKLRSNEKRDALALVDEWRAYWMDQTQNSKEDYDNYFRRAMGVDANMQHHLAKMITDARDKQVELLVALVEKLKKQRDGHIRSAYTDMAIKNYIKEADKELLAIAEEFMEGE